MAELARDLLDRCRVPNRRISELEWCIRPLVAALAPNPLAVPGCGALGAAKILAETGRAGRLRSRAAYARFSGTAPGAGVVIERSILRVVFDGMR